MILVYLLAFVAALIVFALTYQLGILARVLIALLVFAIPAALVTVWIIRVGDKAPPDAVTVSPKGEKLPPSGEQKP